ncbi:Thermophilic_metalloprotease (M29) family protein [Hexamita inflata]|uniref:Thermophilic metalloprotease (M29) family protein n=1 Tax=Hexamita inflata TaxID=28002 RepID=A0AA86UWQ0_9EUKA|nr:Thermophilic metalloprotease (M29) family protein [Hexamita inflata]
MSQLVVQKGVNVQKGDTLIVSCPVECYEFARYITENAYLVGAKTVIINYSDTKIFNKKMQYETEETVLDIPQWLIDRTNMYSDETCCSISICLSDDEACPNMKNASAYGKLKSKLTRANHDNYMQNKQRWCVIVCPTQQWADRVFPNSPDSLSLLLSALHKSCLLDDPVNNLSALNAQLQSNSAYLNSLNLRQLRFTSAQTKTDLTMEFSHPRWLGGSETQQNANRTEFNPNLPTFEVFSGPNVNSVNGFVRGTKPLCYSGAEINDFWFIFKNGVIVEWDCEHQHKEILKKLIQNEGADKLGEVALVPHSSPISQLEIIFYNGLLDENASCHLALGNGYDDCYTDITQMNTSCIHHDFMIGAADMTVEGITADGVAVKIMENGEFVRK